jgi:membrane protein insertase Oxa1/YidC/SpoIIIJ
MENYSFSDYFFVKLLHGFIACMYVGSFLFFIASKLDIKSGSFVYWVFAKLFQAFQKAPINNLHKSSKKLKKSSNKKPH